MKKMLSPALALALCLGLCAFPASAADGGFTINKDGVLIKYNGPGGDVIIPSGVTVIANWAFYNCSSLTSVTISNGVTVIGGSAFENCTNLTSVTIPSSVTRINDTAFYGCTSLTDVTIPSSVTRIGSGAFFGSPWLESLGGFAVVNGILIRYQGPDRAVTIPSSVTRIGGSAFWRCEDLTSVIISDSVSHIEAVAFAGCEDLTSVTIPSSVTYIGAEAFAGCTSLMDVYYTGSRAQWDAIQRDTRSFMEELANTTIYYAADDRQGPPAVTVENIPSSGTACASTQTVLVDGSAVEFQMYALKDENGNGTNYIKLRDLAYVLNGTRAQFAVGYDGTVSLTTGQGYTVTGTEMATPFSGDRDYPSGGALSVKIDGRTVDMTAFTLVDDAGGGYNYFKLRDLGRALGFNVGYRSGQGVFLESGEPYSDAD